MYSGTWTNGSYSDSINFTLSGQLNIPMGGSGFIGYLSAGVSSSFSDIHNGKFIYDGGSASAGGGVISPYGVSGGISAGVYWDGNGSFSGFRINASISYIGDGWGLNFGASFYFDEKGNYQSWDFMAGGHLDGDRLYERYEEYQTEQELQKMYENIVINTDNLIACNDCTPDPGVIGDETIFDYIPNPKSLWKFLRKGIIKRFGKEIRKKPGSLGRFKGRDPLRRENRQVKDVMKKLRLTKDQRNKLHRDIGGEGLNYHEILERAKDMFPKK